MKGYINTHMETEDGLDYEALGMDLPTKRTQIYFNPNHISGAFLTDDKSYIVTFLSGNEIYLEYDEVVWNKIKKILDAVL